MDRDFVQLVLAGLRKVRHFMLAPTLEARQFWSFAPLQCFPDFARLAFHFAVFHLRDLTAVWAFDFEHSSILPRYQADLQRNVGSIPNLWDRNRGSSKGTK